MKKKGNIITLAIILLLGLIVLVVFLGDKKLDINSRKVQDLYNMLGKADINKCGGLLTYSDKEIKTDDIDIENRLCLAYYNIKDEQIKIEKTAKIEKNSGKVSICKISENMEFGPSDDSESECQYKILTAKAIEDSYLAIYGSKLKDFDKSFYISEKEICYREGEEYYCGNAPTFKIIMAPQATIYRVINKATELLNGEIVIYDNFLKLSDEVCYTKNNNIKDEKCSEKISSLDINNKTEITSFAKKYGSTYKHTFKKDKNGNYYWEKSELK